MRAVNQKDERFVEAVESVAQAMELPFYGDYSGRGMFGKECLSVEVDGGDQLARFFFQMGLHVGQRFETTLPHTKMDSMGKGTVVYWEKVQVEDAPRGDDEDEEG